MMLFCNKFFRNLKPLRPEYFDFNRSHLKIVRGKRTIGIFKRLVHPCIILDKPKRAKALDEVLLCKKIFNAGITEILEKMRRRAFYQNSCDVLLFQEKSGGFLRDIARQRCGFFKFVFSGYAFHILQKLGLMMGNILEKRRADTRNVTRANTECLEGVLNF